MGKTMITKGWQNDHMLSWLLMLYNTYCYEKSLYCDYCGHHGHDGHARLLWSVHARISVQQQQLALFA